jgi:uncharacterized ferritin-like protein (DUF455 family)
VNVADYCREILESSALEAKLAPPPARLGDPPDQAPIAIDAPARGRELALGRGEGPLPRLHELGDPARAAVCLARFANHELMAVELFAWALLRWPEAPGGLRRSWLAILRDEQRHARAYCARLEAVGSTLCAHRLSGYFWRHATHIADSPHGPRAFLCAMGLTLEQANLDFAALYRSAFAEVGDGETAAVLDIVHRDEIVHVHHAMTWLRRLAKRAPAGAPVRRGAADEDIALYEAAVPFPLDASRAKGRRFDAGARRRAGLSPAFIEHVRAARPGRSRSPREPR